MWDVLYWTWGCIGIVCIVGDKGWWLWVAIPIYSVWAGWATLSGMRSGLAGMGGGDDDAANKASSGSKRQKKLEKRGGQRVQYR